MVNSAAWRDAVRYLVGQYQVSERRGCRVLGYRRSSYLYQALPNNDQILREAIQRVAKERRRWGCPRILDRLRREGWTDNHKRIERIYTEERLQVKYRKKKRMARGEREPLIQPSRPNQVWTMDFMGDQLANGRRIRILNILDVYSRECLRIEVDRSLPSLRVIRVLEELRGVRGLPEQIMMDNGPEFTSQAMDWWAHARDVKLWFIEPGKPMQNGYIESFNGKFRDECLNEHWFLDTADARRVTEDYRIDYNEVRPHSSLGRLTPKEYSATAELPTAAAPAERASAASMDNSLMTETNVVERQSTNGQNSL